jgi:hypothetical protein
MQIDIFIKPHIIKGNVKSKTLYSLLGVLACSTYNCDNTKVEATAKETIKPIAQEMPSTSTSTKTVAKMKKLELSSEKVVTKVKKLELSPEEVVIELKKRLENDNIDETTLIVWDIDNTLIEDASDQMACGALPIHSEFASIINKTKDKDAINIALTNASPFNTNFKFESGHLSLVSIEPQGFFVKDDPYTDECPEYGLIPQYLKLSLDPNRFITFGELRIEGLRHIGINFAETNFLKLPRIFPPIMTNTDRSNYFATPTTDGKGQYITIDVNQNPQRIRHLIQVEETCQEVVCVPVFSQGIIFGNYVNDYTQTQYAYTKGSILKLFLQLFNEKLNKVFSSVIFIDDTDECVDDVIAAMKEINMPCTGIHILSTKKH